MWRSELRRQCLEHNLARSGAAGDSLGVIARKERYLERKFGSTYLDYKRRARRLRLNYFDSWN